MLCLFPQPLLCVLVLVSGTVQCLFTPWNQPHETWGGRRVKSEEGSFTSLPFVLHILTYTSKPKFWLFAQFSFFCRLHYYTLKNITKTHSVYSFLRSSWWTLIPYHFTPEFLYLMFNISFNFLILCLPHHLPLYHEPIHLHPSKDGIFMKWWVLNCRNISHKISIR